jgi:hypothetical protein
MAPQVFGSSITKLIATLLLQQLASAVYFLAEPDKWRCFKDTVVSNYVSQTFIKPSLILDARDGSSSSRRGSFEQPSQG